MNIPYSPSHKQRIQQHGMTTKKRKAIESVPTQQCRIKAERSWYNTSTENTSAILVLCHTDALCKTDFYFFLVRALRFIFSAEDLAAASNTGVSTRTL